jgi:hypothetical protein
MYSGNVALRQKVPEPKKKRRQTLAGQVPVADMILDELIPLLQTEAKTRQEFLNQKRMPHEPKRAPRRVYIPEYNDVKEVVRNIFRYAGGEYEVSHRHSSNLLVCRIDGNGNNPDHARIARELADQYLDDRANHLVIKGFAYRRTLGRGKFSGEHDVTVVRRTPEGLICRYAEIKTDDTQIDDHDLIRQMLRTEKAFPEIPRWEFSLVKRGPENSLTDERITFYDK